MTNAEISDSLERIKQQLIYSQRKLDMLQAEIKHSVSLCLNLQKLLQRTDSNA